MNGDYTSQADLWSIGVVTFQLLSGEKPFWGNTKKETIKKVRKAEYNFDAPAWKYVSKEAKDFVKHLLEVDPNKRWNAQKALNSAWLKKEADMVHVKLGKDVIEDLEHNGLETYQESSDLKKLALHVIAHKSTTEEIFKLRAAFDEFDENNDGTITYKEFKSALAKSGYDQKSIDSMFKSVDVDGSGSVGYTEFLAATLETQGRVEEQRIAEAFDLFDIDGDGFVSKDELHQVLGKKAGAEDYVEKLMKETDENGDGKISYEEFLHSFQGNRRESVRRMSETVSLTSTST